MAQHTILLLKDVESLGKKGQVVSVAPGYSRNYLLPKQFAVVATAAALRRQKKLQEERLQQAQQDREESEMIARQLEEVVVSITVKVDQEGHMYGSVTAHDISELLSQQSGISIDKKDIILKHSLKVTGTHKVALKLKEGVSTEVTVQVDPDHPVAKKEEV